MREYQINKRNILQQSAKRYEMKKVFIEKTPTQTTSLPKLTVNTAALLSAEVTDKPVEKKVERTLSLSRF